MRFACWITKVTDTHSNYVTHCFFSANIVTRTRPIFKFRCLACLVIQCGRGKTHILTKKGFPLTWFSAFLCWGPRTMVWCCFCSLLMDNPAYAKECYYVFMFLLQRKHEGFCGHVSRNKHVPTSALASNGVTYPVEIYLLPLWIFLRIKHNISHVYSLLKKIKIMETRNACHYSKKEKGFAFPFRFTPYGRFIRSDNTPCTFLSAEYAETCIDIKLLFSDKMKQF